MKIVANKGEEVYKNRIIRRFREKVPSHNRTSESLRLGVILAVVGGFLDAYTFICRGGVFANAETGNIVLLALGLTNKNYKSALMAGVQILFFILGVLVTEEIREHSIKKYNDSIRAEKLILIIEAIVLFIIGFIPNNVPNIFITSIIAFISSIQISSFRRLVDSPYSTTMCTGNLRTASQSAYLAIKKKNKEAETRAIRYFIIILSFLVGASIGGVLTLNFGVKSIWLCSILLIISKFIFSIDEYRFNKYNIKFL
ncbi:YoaK family protein [uncultured Clostridium sp.]|uniref:YoaK family protein n=1 Tax=uncultured Clostridium sp. TaxID=59620 RepID=UPI00258DBD68|nr:YoaK family protein [uncultured Clostridium sp.]